MDERLMSARDCRPRSQELRRSGARDGLVFALSLFAAVAATLLVISMGNG